MSEIVYRPADLDAPSERRFIVDGWCSSYRDANTAGIIQVEDWYSVMIPTVEKILGKPDVRTVVASYVPVTERARHLVGVADLLGFMVADTAERVPLVYYAYTKDHYRRAGNGRFWRGPGVARGLFAAMGIDPEGAFHYVCSTPMCRTLQSKIPLGKWKPLLGRFPKTERRDRR